MTSPLLATEFGQVLTEGGSVSFDYIIRQEDIVGYNAGSPPSYFELVIVGNSDTNVGGGWDQNVIGGDAGYYGGIPSGWTTKQVSLTLAAGGPNASDNTVSWGVGSGWNEFLVGVNSQTGSYTSGTFFIDNFNVSAVPEPGSAIFLVLAGYGMLLRRRR